MTTSSHISRSIEVARHHLAAHPEAARYTDFAASAVVEDGLRCRVDGARGETIYTDMTAAVGGGSSAPSPGWLTRAGHASCEATLISMRAAELGIRLQRVEVLVDSESDARGILAVDDEVPPGPLSFAGQGPDHCARSRAATSARTRRMGGPLLTGLGHGPPCRPSDVEVESAAGALP